MQNNEWKCPFHLRDNAEYVCIKPNCDIQKRIQCKTCISENNGGLLDNLRQLQDVIEEIKQRSILFKDTIQSKEKFTNEMNRIQSKMNGLFESLSYLSIEIRSDSNLTDLSKTVHNFYQSKSKDVEQMQIELKLLQKEALKLQDIANDMITQLNQISIGLVKNINNGTIKFSQLNQINNINDFKYDDFKQLIEPNFEENYILIIQNQAIDILSLENDQIINNNIILGDQNCRITCVIKEKGHPKIIVGYSNGYFQIWEQTSDGVYRSFHLCKDHQYPVIQMILCNNNMLITGSKKSINCWEYNNKSFQWIKIQSWENQNYEINYLCANLNYSLLAVISDHNIFIIRLNQQGQWMIAVEQTFNEKILEACFMKDDDLVICLQGQKYFENINKLILYQRIQLQYLYTNCKIQIQPKFYKDIGLLQLYTDEEQVFIIKQNQKYEIIKIGDKNMKKIRFFNFGQHIVYFQDDPTQNYSYQLKIARIQQK